MNDVVGNPRNRPCGVNCFGASSPATYATQMIPYFAPLVFHTAPTVFPVSFSLHDSSSFQRRRVERRKQAQSNITNSRHCNSTCGRGDFDWSGRQRECVETYCRKKESCAQRQPNMIDEAVGIFDRMLCCTSASNAVLEEPEMTWMHCNSLEHDNE